MNYHKNPTLEEFLRMVSDRIGRKLKDSEIVILKGVWKGQKYVEIAEDKTKGENHYNKGHLFNVGPKLWRDLSEALGEKVNKSNVRLIFERECQRNAQSNLSRCQTQHKDYFVDFLLVTRNTYVESVGNIDSSCNSLFEDSANRLWQKPCGIGEKLTLKNRKAACQPKLEPDTQLTEKIVVQVIDSLVYLCTGKHLEPLEKEVIYGIWKGDNYDDIANRIKRSHCRDREICGNNCQCKYSPNYLRKDVAGGLWSKLSEVFIFLNYEINKESFKLTLERCHEKMKSSFTYNH